MQKVWCFVDDEYVGFQEFYSQLLLASSHPYVMFNALKELDIYNKVYVNGHYFKKVIKFEGGN